MLRTKINGQWVNDPLKDYSKGTSAKGTKGTNELALLRAQRDALVNTLRGVGQCKNITQVRKVLEHGRQTYPLR